MRAECPAPWTDQIPDPDQAQDPFENLLACIQGVFENLVNYPRVPLDQFVLPPDGAGAVIAQAIKDGDALAVSDLLTTPSGRLDRLHLSSLLLKQQMQPCLKKPIL